VNNALISAAWMLALGVAPALAQSEVTKFEARAARFQDAVQHGCLPYAAGEKSEADAMAAIGMKRSTNHYNPLTSPVTGHHYRGGLFARVGVAIDRPGVCRVTVEGDALDAYKRAAERAFEARFGADYAATPAHKYETSAPAPDFEHAFCRDGLLVRTYRSTYRGDAFYNVEVARPWTSKGIPPICPEA